MHGFSSAHGLNSIVAITTEAYAVQLEQCILSYEAESHRSIHACYLLHATSQQDPLTPVEASHRSRNLVRQHIL